MFIQIVIIGIILCVNHVHKSLIRSNNITISMDYAEYNLATESEKELGEYKLLNKQLRVFIICSLYN